MGNQVYSQSHAGNNQISDNSKQIGQSFVAKSVIPEPHPGDQSYVSQSNFNIPSCSVIPKKMYVGSKRKF